MNENWLEKIEDYLNGNLGKEERLLFESELAANEELLSLFKVYSSIETEMRNKAKNAAGEALLKSSLQNLTQRYFNTGTADKQGFDVENRTGSDGLGKVRIMESATPVTRQADPGKDGGRARPIVMWKTLALAAAILGIIALSVTWFFNNQKNSSQVIVRNNKNTDSAKSPVFPDTSANQQSIPNTDIAMPESEGLKPQGPQNNFQLARAKREELFAANFKADDIPARFPEQLEDAMASYKAAKYQVAIEDLKDVDPNLVTMGESTHDAKESAQEVKLTTFYKSYYMGLCYMKSNNDNEAVSEFKKAVSSSPDVISRSKSQWYLALTYLKKGDVKNSDDLLEQLAANTKAGEYRQKASALRQELSKSVNN